MINYNIVRGGFLRHLWYSYNKDNIFWSSSLEGTVDSIPFNTDNLLEAVRLYTVAYLFSKAVEAFWRHIILKTIATLSDTVLQFFNTTQITLAFSSFYNI